LNRLGVVLERGPQAELSVSIDGNSEGSEEPSASVGIAEDLASDESSLGTELGVVQFVLVQTDNRFVIDLIVFVANAASSGLVDFVIRVVIDRAGASGGLLGRHLLAADHGHHVEESLGKSGRRGLDEVGAEEDLGNVLGDVAKVHNDGFVVSGGLCGRVSRVNDRVVEQRCQLSSSLDVTEVGAEVIVASGEEVDLGAGVLVVVESEGNSVRNRLSVGEGLGMRLMVWSQRR